MTIFTLLIFPFILLISLESYNSYIKSGYLSREEVYEKIGLGYVGKRIWNVLEIVLEFVQTLILKAGNHIKIIILLTLVLIIGLNIYGEESVRPIYKKTVINRS